MRVRRGVSFLFVDMLLGGSPAEWKPARTEAGTEATTIGRSGSILNLLGYRVPDGRCGGGDRSDDDDDGTAGEGLTGETRALCFIRLRA